MHMCSMQPCSTLKKEQHSTHMCYIKGSVHGTVHSPGFTLSHAIDAHGYWLDGF